MAKPIGEFLKRADQFIRINNFDEAERLVNTALEYEPSNVYAIAYKERIKLLRLQHEEKLRREAEERRRQEEALRLAREQRENEGTEQQQKASPKDIERYKELLEEAWRNGLPPSSQRIALERARQTLNISPEIHKVLEKEVKLNAYVTAVKIAWKEGSITPSKGEVLEELRRKYSVSLEEHVKVEPKILWEIQERKHTETLFLIDDEKEFVSTMRVVLQSYGFTVLTATSPEEALHLLKSITPDLILLDVRFPGSKLTGFTLYEEIRRMTEFSFVPIIFLTALTDEQTYQRGLQLGADDILTKPFTNDMLVAAVEGKLKRYQEIKNLQRR
jgi:CheY-like chemotaxis protein